MGWRLCERFGYTHDDVARKVGKSRTTVTEALAIAKIPEDVREVCRAAEIGAKSSLLQIVRQPDDESMRRFAKQMASQGLKRNDAREARRQEMGHEWCPSRNLTRSSTLHPMVISMSRFALKRRR